MSQLHTRIVIGDNFDYSEFTEFFTEEDIKKGESKLINVFKHQTKEWNVEKNSEWVLRHYLAVKMIMAASVMLSSLDYARKNNLRITEPYLSYYAILSSARAVLYTNPNALWNKGKLIESTHSKITNIVVDAISQFNKAKGQKIKTVIEGAREYRELFSYKFPANGISDLEIGFDKAVKVCALLAELAQFQSEVMQEMIFAEKGRVFEIDKAVFKVAYSYQGTQYAFVDSDDLHRINYIFRKQPYPVSLYLTMNEGMVEDFFGAWCSMDDKENEQGYNPDTNWRIIFPMP